MALKDLLVVLDASKHCAQRVTAAAGLARRSAARLTALYVLPSLDISPFLADQFPADAVDAIHAQVAQRRDRAMELFNRQCAAAGIAGEWIEERGDPLEYGTAHARRFDLAILGQIDPTESHEEIDAVEPEPLIMAAGRPIIMVPHSGSFESPGERILVAWNGSQQAARAVNDALPLLKAARQVLVMTIEDGSVPSSPAELATRDILPHLERHGIAAEARHIVADHTGIGDALLSAVGDEGTDLVVMGVYGHSRLRELALGGVSRHLLEHMTVPLFLSH